MSTTLVLKKIQIKITNRYHYTPTTMNIIRKTISVVSDDVEDGECSHSAGGKGKWNDPF